MSAALDFHRATNVAAGGTDEDEVRTIETKPSVFKDYGDAERLPLETSIAGPVLRDGAGVVRSQDRRDYGGGTIHWRAYSSAGALFPVETYVATSGGLWSFDPLTPGLVRAGGDVREQLVPGAEEVIALTGLHSRTGWKYMERGYRHVWWDAGTMVANLLALAAAEGLAPRLHVGFVDAQANEALGVDGENEYALALIELGRPT
jgi:SagB-type dehydrogenase family enzyme